MAESESPSIDMLTPPPPPAPISITDLLSDVEVLQQKEAADKASLDAIGTSTHESLRPKLVTWALAGFPNAYALMEVTVNPPPQCSDGVVRGLTDYIVFCSGKTIQEHVALLQEKLADMTVSFANLGHAIAVVVSRA
jgi:hypothetical protein